MSRNLFKYSLSASIALAALGLSTQQSAAVPAAPVVVVTTAGTSAWPVWVLGGGVVSLMLRAAYVYNTECRELTSNEAFTGVVPLWPVYHKPSNQCFMPARKRR